jgi:putative hydrolase of the HAD superfamily
MLEVIAFDADDTLWHNEQFYQATKKKLQDLLSPEYDPERVMEKINEYDVGNLSVFGYGVKSFILSLIESALDVTGGEISGEIVQQIINFGKQMLSNEVLLFDDAHQILGELSVSFDLMLITKGENVEQQMKIKRSGLAEYFKYIEIVSDKNSHTYHEILRKFEIHPRHFLMIGNSLKSDILPVLDIGGEAVFIPAELTWFHEAEVDSDLSEDDYYEIENLSQLPALIHQINSKV